MGFVHTTRLLHALLRILAREGRALCQARRAARSHSACRTAACKALGFASGGSTCATSPIPECGCPDSAGRRHFYACLRVNLKLTKQRRDKGAVTPTVLILLHPLAGEGLPQEPPGSPAPSTSPSATPCCAVGAAALPCTQYPRGPRVVAQSGITADLQSAVSEGDLHDIETEITETREKGKEKAKGVKR